MIVIEDRLRELFNRLPNIQDVSGNEFKPVYHFGDGIELNQFLKENENTIYPLIYQTSMRANINKDRDEAVIRPLEFFIATKAKPEKNNTQRWNTTYQNILRPLFDNIQTIFECCGIVRTEQSEVWQVENFPKYSQNQATRNENIEIDIIDAIKVSLNCTIENTCITEYIKFK